MVKDLPTRNRKWSVEKLPPMPEIQIDAGKGEKRSPETETRRNRDPGRREEKKKKNRNEETSARRGLGGPGI